MKVYTTGEVSKICKVATTTVNKWFDSGKLPGFRVPGSRHRRIPQENLVRFLREHGVPLGPLGEQMATKVLVVTQDRQLQLRLENELTRARGFELTFTASGFEAGTQIESASPDGIIVDFGIGPVEALRMCDNVRGNPALADTVVVALVPDDRTFAAVQASKVDEAFKKPFDPDLLVERFGSLMGRRTMARQRA